MAVVPRDVPIREANLVSMRPKLVTIWASYGPYHLARVNALEESGFEVFAYSYSNLVPSYEFFKERPARYRLINDCPTDSVNPLLSWWRTLWQLWRDRPELIMACGYERPETLAALMYVYLKRFAWRQPTMVMIMMDNQIGDRRRAPFIEAVKRLYLRLFDGFCIGGATCLDYLIHLHVDRRKIALGYNCVDNALIARIAAKHRESGTSPQGSNYFLTLSRLFAMKNIGLVIDSYAEYRKVLQPDVEPWHLVIAGGGPEHTALKDRILHHNLESSIHMVGTVDQFDDAVRYYAFCRAFVLASTSETWGLVVNEAMAAGVPVLVSRQCGCSGELVKPGLNGFVFDSDSVSELTDRLLWMHRNQHQLQAMGQASLSVIDEYSPRNFGENVSGYYWARRAASTLESLRPPDR
jgi:1,2-diacylglycerol 3-alpha-glucosyltransferase